jgi:hypothetical protein
MANTDFYFKKTPPSKPVTVRSTVVIRLPLFEYTSHGLDSNNYPSFQTLYRSLTAEGFANTVLTNGAINKAIKNALLYNYFGFPVSNIALSKQNNNYKKGSLQFGSQNTYNLKYTDFTINSDGNDLSVLTYDKAGQESAPSVLASKEFYQYGFIKPLPDFKDLQDPENFLLYENEDDGEAFSFQDIDSNLGTNFMKDIFMCLHGSDTTDYSSNNIGGFNSFVEPVGVNSRGSLFYALNNGPGLEIINFSLFSGPAMDFKKHEQGLIAQTIEDKDFLENITSWNSPYNPVDKTYSRAWMPTAPVPDYKSWLNYISPNALTTFNPSPTLLAIDPNTGEDIPLSTAIQYTQKLNASSQVDEESIDASWDRPLGDPHGGGQIDSLALFLKPYETSDWYQAFPGYGQVSTDQYKYIQEFQKYNIASMYKLVPAEGLNNLEYFLEDPARTLNDIYANIFKYVTDIVPTAPLPSTLHEQAVGNVTVIDPNKVEGTELKLSNVLRKFRLSADDYSTKKYYNTPEKKSLGFNHTIGNNDASGKELIDSVAEGSGLDPQALEARNKFVLVTKTEAQREYIIKNVKVGDIDYSSKDPNFLYSSFPSPIPDNLRENLLDVLNNGGEGYPLSPLNELERAYKFSDYLLSSLYFKLPPYYSKSFENKADETIKHAPERIGIKLKIPWQFTTGDLGSTEAKKQKLYESFLSQVEGQSGGALQSGQIPFATFLFDPSLQNSGLLEGTSVSSLQETWEEQVSGNSTKTVNFVGLNVEEDSPFSFPVWNYSYQDLYKIKWNNIGDFPLGAGANVQMTNLVNSNPSAEYVKDYGIPEWVRGLRIYPTLDNDTTITRPDNSSLSNSNNSDYIVTEQDLDDFLDTGDAEAENNSYLTGYKSYSSNETSEVNIVNKMIPAVTLVMEPKINSNGTFDTTFVSIDHAQQAEDFDLRENNSYVDIRYAVEIDIDERDLILDMLGQGVYALAGELSDYEKLGFDIEKLLFKSNGNLASQSLIEAYEEADFTFEGLGGNDFGSFSDLVGLEADACPIYPPDQVNKKVTNILATSSDPYAATSYVCLDETDFLTTQLKESAGKESKNLGYLKSNTVVKVLKEWVNGKGEFNKIRIVDSGSPLDGTEGFIDPRVLRPVFPNLSIDKKIFFDQVFADKKNEDGNLTPYKLAPATVTTMGEFADAIKPDWWRDANMRYGQPYEYIQEGEYWYTVELTDHECIPDDSSLQQMIYQAKVKGLKELLNFYGKEYTDEDIDKLINTYLAVRIDIDTQDTGGDPGKNGVHVSDRPGDPILFLLKAGAIYINALPDKQDALDELKQESVKIISLNTRWYQAHIQQAVYALNALYYDILSSEYRVPSFNFKKETERLSFISSYMKRILAVNGYDLDSQEDNVINIGFDSQYRVTFFSYKEKDQEEKLLKVGYEYFSAQEPFVFKNTMALLYRHRQIKDPTLKSNWQKLFTQWLPDPKPEIVPKGQETGFPSDSQCKPNLTWSPPPLSQIWEQVAANLDQLLDLDPRYDLGSFRFNLLQYFPPCPKPPAGRGLTVLRLLSEIEGETQVFDDLDILNAVASEVDRVGQYVGDFMSSQQALEEIKLKIFTLDDLYEFLLNYISPELLYSKICKCFIDLLGVQDIGVPNLEINATGGSGGLNLNPSQIGKDSKEILDVQGPEAGASIENEILRSEDLFCSFCFRVPSVFLRLPSTDILAELINAFKKLLEFALAQLLLQLIASLLDVLLTCPDLECAPGASKVKDYGTQDIANIFNNSVPEGRLSDFISECGLLIDGENITEEEVITMLQEVSDRLTTSEVIGILSGTPTKTSLKTVERVVSHYPSISAVMSDIGQIENFFMCAGDKIDQGVFDLLEQGNIDNITDPAVCINFNELSADNILDKCGNLPEGIAKAIKNRNLNHDLSKYKKIADFIRQNDDLSNQLPSLFEDGKGTQALLSSLNAETADYMLDQTIDTISIPIATQLSKESNNLTNPSANKLIKGDLGLDLLYKQPLSNFIVLGLGKKDGTDKHSGLVSQVENPETGEVETKSVEISQILGDLSNSLYFDKENYQISLTSQGGTNAFCQLKFNPPKKDPQTQDYVYSNNYTTTVKSTIPFFSEEINFSIVGNEAQIPEDVKQFIQKFELKNSSVPEQAQVFGNVIVNEINNLLELSNISDSQISDQVDKLKEIFETELYINSLSTIVDNITEVVSNGTILQDYNVDKRGEVEDSIPTQLALATILVPFTLVPIAGTILATKIASNSWNGIVKEFYPDYTRKQLQHLNLAPNFGYSDSSGNKSSGIIDFELVKQIVKDNYNFAKQTDENSESLGMPQLSILNGLISAFTQLFSGEAYAKGVYTLAHYPKEVFDENLNGGILSYYVAEFLIRYLEDIVASTEENDFKVAWESAITRILAEKPEFTNLMPNEALPGLIGESSDKGDNIVGLGGIDGKIYDTVTGKEEIIKSYEDATRYFVRQNMAPPMRFIKNRLNSVNYYNDATRDQETNPFDTLVYNELLEVHDGIVSDFQFTLNPDTISELEIDDQAEAVLILPEVQEEELENYFVSKKESSLFSAGTGDAVTNEFANGKFFYQYYFRIEDWSSEQEASENEGIYVENLVKRQLKGSSEVDDNLKQVINRGSFIKILENMYPAGENYNLTGDQTKEPINKFFKSIKYGVRLCYGIIQSTDDNIILQKPESLELADTINQVIKKIHQNDKGKEFCKNEKVFKIVEVDVDKLVYNPFASQVQDKRISYVIPIKSKEVDIKSFNMFKISIAEFIEEDNQFEIIEFNEEHKTLRNSMFADLNGFKEGSENVEFKTLFNYCIPLPMLVNIFLTYNVTILSTDKEVKEAFDNTKQVIKEIFNSTYFNVRGSKYWKNVDSHTSSRGGPLGIATSATLKKT